MMRLVMMIALAAGFFVSVESTGAQAAEDATRLGPCKETVPAALAASPSGANVLSLLGSVTQLGSKAGRPVLESNLAATVAINVEASPEAGAQALIDTFITDTNANILADGLGATMGAIYRRKAVVESQDDGATSRCGDISPAVGALFAAMNRTSGSDSQAAKFSFADGAGGKYAPPPGGTLDVLGKAYGVPAGAPGSDPRGNSRPFQVAPVGALSGPRLRTYDGKDFFGVATNSRLMLTEATPAEAAAGLTGSDLTKNPSFPSGHTTFGYTESLLLALMVPERLRELAYRGSEYGDSRIVVGAHYAIDVIGGRTLATYDLAQALAGRLSYGDSNGTFQGALAAATTDLRAYLQANGCPNIAACAAHDPIVRAGNAAILVDARMQPATPREAYAFRLHYGLAAMGATDRPPEPVPEEAGFLLQSRFPYLTQAQRREILRTTEGPSGYFLDVSPVDGAPLSKAEGGEAEVGVYSRLDLFAAAGGYAAFENDVVVNQDPAAITDPNLHSFASLARADVWSNDIAGPGGLTKQGAGVLTLAGANTFAGPTRVENGTLEIAGSLRSATKVEASGTLAGTGTLGDIAVGKGGTLAPGPLARDQTGPLRAKGSLSFGEGSAFRIASAGSEVPLVQVAGKANLGGADLVVAPVRPPQPGTRLTLLTAEGGVQGAFRRVQVQKSALVPKLTYTADAVYLTFEEKSAAQSAPSP